MQVLENNDLFSAVGDYVHRSDNKAICLIPQPPTLEPSAPKPLNNACRSDNKAISEMVDRRLLEVEKQFKKEVAEGETPDPKH
jgi:hypothetical protein